MAADVKEVNLVAERSTKHDPGTWTMKALFSPTGMVGEKDYRVRFILSDRDLNWLPAVGSAQAMFTALENGKDHSLQFDVPAGGLLADALVDGGADNRIELIAHVEIFDPAVSDQDPVARRPSPGLDLFVS